jgi:hypothetical protein
MSYQVIDLENDKSRGVFDTLGQARDFVRANRLHAYSIWRGWVMAGGSFYAVLRVERCLAFTPTSTGNDL